jgi:hypothetical protein
MRSDYRINVSAGSADQAACANTKWCYKRETTASKFVSLFSDFWVGFWFPPNCARSAPKALLQPSECGIHLADKKSHGRCCGARSLRVAKRQPVDLDYIAFSKYYEDVRAEMLKANYSAITKDVGMAKQAEQMGLTAQECATVIIRNRNKRKSRSTLA